MVETRDIAGSMTQPRTALLTTVAARAVAFAAEPGPVTAGMRVDPSTVARGIGTQSAADRSDPYLKRGADNAFMLGYWDKTDALVDGIEAMRLARETYLPRFQDEEEAGYKYRLSMTKMTNVYRDVVEGLSNKPFEKEVSLVEDDNHKPPQEAIDFCEDVDGSGNNLTAFAVQTFFNGINSAVDWIFVDHDKADPNVRTVADAKRVGSRPYWSHIIGRNMLDAQIAVIGGKETLTYARIEEPGTPHRVRVFERDATGLVTWELREKGTATVSSPLGDTKFAVVDNGTITIGKIPLVPFYTGRRDGRTFRFFPAMRDAADLQIDLYQDESGLKFAKTLTAYPMLAANGIAPPKDTAGNVQKLAVGPNKVLYSAPNGDGNYGSWAYVEPSASSLTFLAANIKESIENLREIGRQPLTAQSGNITTITAGISAGKAKSAVAQWGLGLKNALENAMVLTMEWMNVKQETYDPSVFVYTDFDEFMDGKDLETIDADRDRGDISRETLWEEKKRRGIYGEEFTAEREQTRLLKEVPGDTGEDIDPDTPPITGTKPVRKPPLKEPAE